MNISSTYLLSTFLICLVTTLFPSTMKAQGNKKVLLTDLFIAAIESEKDTTFIDLDIDMSNLTDEYLAIGEYLKLRFPNKILVENDQVVIQHKIAFENCTASNVLELRKMAFKDEISFINCDFSNLSISASYFKEFRSFENRYQGVEITNNQFIGNLSFIGDNIAKRFSAEGNELSAKLHFDIESSGGDFFITDNQFLTKKNLELFSIKNDSLLFGRSWTIQDRVDLYIRSSPEFLVFSDNKSQKSNAIEVYRFLGNFKSIDLNNNDLGGILFLSTMSDYYMISENNFEHFDISTSSFSETQNVIDWNQFDGNKLLVNNFLDFVNTDQNGFENINFLDVGLKDSSSMKVYGTYQSDYLTDIYLGQNDLEMGHKSNYNQLLRSYYRLYTVFKAEGDIISANSCYTEMKDLETRRLRYNYKQAGGFDNFFRWRLNTLLKTYTDYGTNPAKAVRMSFYIIITFGLFYFFFPSDWDKESKKKMIVDFKRFIKKNDHGYVKPFAKLSLGVFLSLVNGLMLSLNAFVTLGFGKIPTTGFPRYVCIIQGFIGWFLLSLFTVSLINQVLF